MYLDLATLYDNCVVFLWSNTTHRKASWWLKETVQNILVPKTFRPNNGYELFIDS